MVFSSPIFLFYFLPILIGLYVVTPRAFKNILLLSASLLFYAWGEGFYLLLMLVSIGLNFYFGLLVGKHNHRLALATGIAANLAILVSYKYANFIVDNLNWLLNQFDVTPLVIAPVYLPLGISFFTFQAISYLIDISRGEAKAQRNPLNLGLYIAMFPQLIAGPIVRYQTVVAAIEHRRVTAALFVSGAERFVIGLSKKMLIANPLGAVVDVIFSLPAESVPTHVAWLGIILYALQIFFDFSGYSDMAIGLGRMFGFRFLENFNYPYMARSLQDFWRRWHISLSTWFRDYLYIPLGGNRINPVRTYLNLFTVFLLCGIWHGASWNFLIWGLLHGLVLALERAGLLHWLHKAWAPIQHIYLLVVVLVTWVFFRADTLGQAIDYLANMFSWRLFEVPFDVLEKFTLEMIIALTLGLLFCKPWSVLPARDEASVLTASTISGSLRALAVGLLLIASAMQLAVSTHNPFIYFRF